MSLRIGKNKKYSILMEGTGITIAICHGKHRESNAAAIVEACNSFEKHIKESFSSGFASGFKKGLLENDQ